MIVYVESNFVLELAFMQEEHESCEEIIGLAQIDNVRLVLPAFSIGEPYEAWVRRSKRRQELYNALVTETQELSRSKPYRESSKELRELTNLLVQSGEEEKRRLDEVLDRILNITEIIPIGQETIKAAISLQKSRSLKPQDSIVYASVLQHLKDAPAIPKCFITKNAKDFLNPDIENELAAYDCKLLVSFGNGLKYASH
jgi:hypothetical protein